MEEAIKPFSIQKHFSAGPLDWAIELIEWGKP